MVQVTNTTFSYNIFTQNCFQIQFQKVKIFNQGMPRVL